MKKTILQRRKTMVAKLHSYFTVVCEPPNHDGPVHECPSDAWDAWFRENKIPQKDKAAVVKVVTESGATLIESHSFQGAMDSTIHDQTGEDWRPCTSQQDAYLARSGSNDE